MSATMTNPDLRRKIKVRIRPDLSITRHRYAGQTFFVVKDPVSLRYYRFREEELFLLQQLDGKRTLDDVRHAFVEKFRPQRISVTELEKFVGQLLYSGIATTDTPQVGQRLYERYKKRRLEKVKQFFLNILYLKIPVFDPDWLLAKLLPATKFLFTIWFLVLACTLASASALLVLVNWDTFVSKLPSYSEFFTWRNVFYFWTTLAVVKILHEFGHGVSCKRFGGEVHEMGFLFLVLTPCLYCNVTDAWMLPNKWHRAVIGAAGMYVELILSSLFVWIWWYTEPGLLNTLSLSIIFICSVSTVLFNGNPLLRFDGYYILSDLLEIPNLRERSNKFLGNQASKLFFGSEAVEDPYAPKQRRTFFVVYAIAAYIYRWFVTIAILWFLYRFLKPYKLAVISAMLATAAAAVLLVVPIYRIVRTLRMRWRVMKVNKLRMVSSLATAAAVLAAVLLVPLPMRIHAPMVLRPRNATTVFVQVPGVLTDLYDSGDGDHELDGDVVAAGATLARLEDPERRKELERLHLEQAQHERAQLTYSGVGEYGQQRVAAVRLASVRDQIKGNLELERRLTVTVPANVSGTVIGPPKRDSLGAYYDAGQTFCQIGDPTDLEAYIVVEHSDISLVRPGQVVWLKLAGHVGEILEGAVSHVSSRELDELPPALSNKQGGEVATTTDEQSKREVPMFKSYSIQVPVPNREGTLVPGVRGIARFDVGYRSLYWRLKRYLHQTLRFRV